MPVICDVHGGAARSGYLGNVARDNQEDKVLTKLMEVIERVPRL